ncbi:MAG: bifunctional UDP-N-acetylglucosamine pyrophosphorylase/glucosamine-1-phosphate N-acetyltransferase [Planctomycetota bacterium]|jgi:bifunctional UDP-N-acetylglucosamine pyrophosphorylase/glucosamine-1-phosphate N-acetyltransferase
MGAIGTIVILAAGQGTRMKSERPKVLHSICGRPLLAYVIDQALSLNPDRVVVVVGKGADAVQDAVKADFPSEPILFEVQEQQLGTGHAVLCALPSVLPGPSLILYGDMPLLRPESLQALLDLREVNDASGAILTVNAQNPRGFGRIIRKGGVEGPLERIVEEKDATAEQRAISEVNVGVYAFAEGVLEEYLPSLSKENAQGEYYLTDVGAALVNAGRPVLPLQLENEEETIGINTLAQLSEARAGLQERILLDHMVNGVYIEDPATTYIDFGVEIGVGTQIFPCSVLRRGAKVGRDCEVGPFSHLRTGTVLADGSHVGNFTETKNASLGEKTKAKHLSYLGDVEIGSKVNIGAGTIVANYDGKLKHKTKIGDRAFIGSGSVLIAPTVVGEGALTGGGAVVTRGSEIPAEDVWVGVPARSLNRKSDGSPTNRP